MEQMILLVAGIVIVILAVVLVRKSAVGKKELQQVEGIIDRYFTELQEETEKLHRAYLEDVNFLQKKVNSLEQQVRHIQQAKQIDIKVDQTSEAHLSKQKKAKSAYEQKYMNVMDSTLIEDRDDAKRGLDVQEQLGSESLADREAITAKEQANGDSSISSQVIALHQQGMSVEEIAKQLNMMCGEVQLMVGLFRRKSEV